MNENIKKIKTTIDEFSKDKKNIFDPFIMVGVYMEFEDQFLDWLLDKGEEIGLDVNKICEIEEYPVGYIFDEIKEKYEITSDLEWVSGVETLYINEDCIVIGVPIHQINPCYSLKRIFTDVRSDLEKIGLLSSKDDANAVKWFVDFYMKEKKIDEMEEKSEKS